MKKIVGKVTTDERDRIQRLFERRNGLRELAKIITTDDNALYEKLVEDMARTSSSFQNWWDSMYAKYTWESADNGNWEIDFNDCSVYLVIPDPDYTV